MRNFLIVLKWSGPLGPNGFDKVKSSNAAAVSAYGDRDNRAAGVPIPLTVHKRNCHEWRLRAGFDPFRTSDGNASPGFRARD
jgi:hypothetical protein